MTSQAEIQRRYSNLRAAMAREDCDALLVCGNQYAGFEGAVRYVSGFEIVHRYALVLLPMEGEPTLLFPAEARWIGDKTKPWVISEEHTSELQSPDHLVCRLLLEKKLRKKK